MFKLSRKVEYALMALNYLKKNQHKSSVKDISSHLHVPFDTVSKVLQILNNHSIVGSEKGINGGYYLKDKLSELNLYDFCELIEPKPLTRQCSHEGHLNEGATCEMFEHCNITNALTSFNNLITNFLKQISVDELLNNPNQFKHTELLKMNNL